MTLQDIIVSNVTVANLAWAALAYFLVAVIVSFWKAPKYPITIPWAGHGKGWLAAIPNVLNGFTNSRRWIFEAYEQHNKNGRPFVIPPGLGAIAEVVLPREQIQWMLDQPDEILSNHAATYDILNGDYMFVKPIILQDPYHEHVIHKNLARNVTAILPEINDQVCRDADAFFGESNEWHKVNVLDVFMKLVPRITNRMLVGETLCENENFLYHIGAFVDNIISGFLVFPLTPRTLRPVVGGFMGLTAKWHAWRLLKYTLPVIKQRLAILATDAAKGKMAEQLDVPNDYITWHIKTAISEGRLEEIEPWRISVRIMPLDFAAIHTTAMTGHAALLDMLSADPSVLQQLREEAERVHREEGGQWTKKGLAKMYRMDSAIRESQRYSSFSLTFIRREVMPKEGITGPDGTHHPKGCVLSAAWAPISSDEDLFPNADKYDAFRYSREREAYEARPAEDRDSADALKLKQSSIVTTSEKHLPFGHGRHAW